MLLDSMILEIAESVKMIKKVSEIFTMYYREGNARHIINLLMIYHWLQANNEASGVGIIYT
jgi:hypothetical protein